MNFIPASELILNADQSIYHLNLLPEHIADTIIAVGDPERVSKVSQYFDNIEFSIQKREFITHTGSYKGKRLTVISTGMGTDNVEIFLTELDALVNIDLKNRQEKAIKTPLNIIRIGTSGTLCKDIAVGSELVSENAVGIDTLMCFYHLPQSAQQLSIGQALQKDLGLPFTPYCVEGSQKLYKQLAFDMIKGNTLTCPGFYAPQGRKLRADLIKPDYIELLKNFKVNDFALTNFEMETAGYYALGKILGHEVISLNAIVANRVTHEFATNADAVMDNLIRKVLDRL